MLATEINNKKIIKTENTRRTRTATTKKTDAVQTIKQTRKK